MTMRIALLVLLNLCFLCFAVAVPAYGGSPTIAVDEAQRVTVSGSFDSLRSVIIELCTLAGVELRAYDAEDRPFAAGYEEIPLAAALARLLRSEIYLAGLRRTGKEGGATVTWLRVSGSKADGGGSPLVASSAGAKPAITVEPGIDAIDLGVAPKILETALTSSDTTARNTARRRILEALSEDQASLQRYVRRDVTVVVDELASFPHATELVGSLQNVTRDVSERNQLQAILRALRLRQLDDDGGNG